MVNKVIRDGKVAVLVSPGFGAGWSTWGSEHANIVLFHPEIVKWVEEGKKGDIEEIIKEILGPDAYFYTGGARDLEIEWLPIGTLFQITEYDGSETLKTMKDTNWKTA